MVPSFEKRIRAFAIDTSGAIIVTLIASFGVAPFNQILAQVISLVGLFLFYLFPYFKNTGQTLGKRVQKIKVVMKNNLPAPIWLLIVRDFTKISLSIITSGLYMILKKILYLILELMIMKQRFNGMKIYLIKIRRIFVNTWESLKRKRYVML